MKSASSPSPTEKLDTLAHAALARMTGSLSPVSGLLAWQDWWAHLAISPGKQVELAQLAITQTLALMHHLQERMLAPPGDARRLVEPPALDRRFRDPEWRDWPFHLWHQAFLLNQAWWDAATRDVKGVTPHH